MKIKEFFVTFRQKYNVVSSSLLFLLLFLIENLLETEFTCPNPSAWATAYSLFYFLVPALICFIVQLRLMSDCWPCCCCCPSEDEEKAACSFCRWLKLTGEVFSMPVMWVILLLLDGRYGACLYHSLRATAVTASNGTNPDIDKVFVISVIQVIGMWLLAFFVFIWAVYASRNDAACCRVAQWYREYALKKQKEDYHSALMKKAEIVIEEMFVEEELSYFKEALDNDGESEGRQVKSIEWLETSKANILKKAKTEIQHYVDNINDIP